MNLLSLLSFFVCITYIYLGIYVLRLDHRSRPNWVFFATCLGAAIWSFSYTFIYPAADPVDIVFWHRLSSIGWCLIPASFLHFSLLYAGNGDRPGMQWKYSLIYLPAIFFLYRSITGTLTEVRFIRLTPGWTDVIDMTSPLFIAYISMTGVYLIIGLVLIIRRGMKSADRRLRRQAVVITVSSSIAFVFIFISEIIVPLLGFGVVPVMGHVPLLIISFGIWYAIVRYKFMSLSTAMAADHILERIRDIILLLDPGRRIIRVNRQAEKILNRPLDGLNGMPIDDLVLNFDDFREQLSGLFDGVAASCRMEMHLIGKNGEAIPADCFFSVISESGGEPAGVLMVGYDMRETNRMIQEVREGEQREHEERFRTLITHSSDIITIIDEKGNIKFVSPSVKYILNFEPNEVTGKSPLVFIHPDDAPAAEKYFMLLLRKPGQLMSRKVRLKSKDGSWRIFDVNFKNLLYDETIKGVVVNFRDITERKEYENQLAEFRQDLSSMVQERTEELQIANQQLIREIAERREAESRLREQGRYLLALHNTALSIIDRLDIMELLQSIVENACALINAPHGYIALVSSDESGLITMVGTGVFRRRAGDQFSSGQGICGSVWAKGETISVDNYSQFSNRIPGSDLDSLRALVATPLKSQTNISGVIGLARDIDNDVFDENEILLLTRFAEMASLALFNARLYESLQVELAERRRVEESLWVSNEKYRTILESIEDGYYETDLRGNLTFVNSSLCRILGYPVNELTGLNYRVYVDDKNAREVFLTFNRVFLDGRPRKTFEWELIRKDKITITVEASVSLITDRQGNSTGFRGVLRDISERKNLERSLKHLAHHDILTGLPNRILFTDRLNHAIAMADRNLSLMAVLFMDLDNFKEVNDNLGHDVGDILLKEVASRLQESIREIDTVARFGGDEFIFILPELKNTESASGVVRRIRSAFAQPYLIRDNRITITPSMGVAFYPTDSDNPESLLKKADMAQYHAKESGKNDCKYYSASMMK